MQELSRSNGILLHISSLPGKYGIGDLGKEAFRWVDFLSQARVKYWQILPLNPIGYGNSPYQGLSAFAGNPLFIDLEELVELKLLDSRDLKKRPWFSNKKVDFPKVTAFKSALLQQAFNTFTTKQPVELSQAFSAFKKEKSAWLKDFAIFMAIREKFKGDNWIEWPDPYRRRNAKTLKSFMHSEATNIEYHKFLQYLFSRQIEKLKKYTNTKNIEIIGDIPIFMGFNSVDVWANPHLFDLDENLQPTAIAGVPPDYFSEEGQLWGNPLYDWEAHKKEKYTWWISRIVETLKTVDVIRLDHFRGFAGYYRIPADSKTAKNGEWVRGPGEEFLDNIQGKLGNMPFIAEDLGVITPDVTALRERYSLPGMRLIQFASWEDADDEFLPHNYPENCAAYTGTHDNDTTVNWYKHASRKRKRFFKNYLGGEVHDIAHAMIEAIWQSRAVIAIAPMQDFLCLGGWARMNIPATAEGNWRWRMRLFEVNDRLAVWIKEINLKYGRISEAND